jgi:hypothetical protein
MERGVVLTKGDGEGSGGVVGGAEDEAAEVHVLFADVGAAGEKRSGQPGGGEVGGRDRILFVEDVSAERTPSSRWIGGAGGWGDEERTRFGGAVARGIS